MKFIFPQNYDFRNKLLGIIDYSTVIANIIWDIFIFIIINVLFTSINLKIFFCIFLCFPILLLSISGFNGENFLYVFSYMFNFAFKQKLYLYNKK